MTKRRTKKAKISPQPIPAPPPNSLLITRLAMCGLGSMILFSVAVALVGIFVRNARVSDSLGYAGFSIGLTVWTMFWVKWEMILGTNRYPGDIWRNKQPTRYWGQIAFVLLIVFMLERFYIQHCILESNTSRQVQDRPAEKAAGSGR